MLKDEVLNEYIKYELKSNEDNKYNGEDASQIFSTLNYEQFQKVYISILSHQSEYFRAIYNNKEKEIDYGHLAINATQLARKAFDTYDINGNGFIERTELEKLFEDIGLKELHKRNFEKFMDVQFDIYDANYDGVISYEEFINIHNNLMFSC